MPLYDYVCEACGHTFEISQSFKDDPIAECPNCGGPVRRVIAATAIIFKGSGWYATDSKRAAARPGTAKPTETSAEASPGTSTEAGSAPAAPSDTAPSKPETGKAAKEPASGAAASSDKKDG